MKVQYDIEGIFIRRINKFLGEVKIGNRKELIHIHDPGRIEHLKKGAKVLLKREENPKRKTKYDLIAVGNEKIFTNSRYHNSIAEVLLKERFQNIEREVKINDSRIDFLVDGVPLEVKGCTLMKNKIALFPDAPTKRGLRHLKEIIKQRGYLMFLIFRNANCFAPNPLDEKFYTTFKKNLGKFKTINVVLKYDGIWIKFVREIPICQTF